MVSTTNSGIVTSGRNLIDTYNDEEFSASNCYGSSSSKCSDYYSPEISSRNRPIVPNTELSPYRYPVPLNPIPLISPPALEPLPKSDVKILNPLKPIDSLNNVLPSDRQNQIQDIINRSN